MSDLDNAINSINASAAKAENTAGFLDDMSTFDDQSSVTNPNNGQTVASIPKQVKDRTDELFTAAESDINQAVSDAAQSATDAQDAADSIGRYQGLWPDTGGSANKGDTYQTQVSGTPTGQYFEALQDTTVDPIGDDVNWRSVVSEQWVADNFSNTNLLSNHNFLIQTPGDSQPAPSATPTSYPPGYQIFSGVFANETTGISNLTYIDGRVSFSGGDLYFSVPNTGGLERLNADQFVASVADFDGRPRTRGVSFALVGDEYRVTVGIDALSDGVDDTLLGSVKFEQGSVATGHLVQLNIQKKITTSRDSLTDLSSLTEDYTVYLDSEVAITSTKSIVCRVVKVGGGIFDISAGVTLSIYNLDCGPFQVFRGDGDVKLFNSINTETYPEWFGAVAYSNIQETLDGVDSQPFMQKLHSSLPAFGGEVKWSGLYGVDASLDIDRQGIHIKGIGAGLAAGIIAKNDVTAVNIQTGVFECHMSDVYISGYKDRNLNIQGTKPCIKASNAFLLRFTNIYTEEGSAAAEFTNCSDMHIQSWLGEDSTSGITLIGCIQNTFNELNFFELNKLGSTGSPVGHAIKVNSTSTDNTFTNLNYRQTDKKLKDGLVIEGADNAFGVGAITDVANAAITLQGTNCTGNTLMGINSRNCARHALIQLSATRNEINGGKAKNCGTGLKIVSDAGDNNDISITFDGATTNISVDDGAPQQVIDPKMLRQFGTTAQRPTANTGVMIGFKYTNLTTSTVETWDGTTWLSY